MRYYITFAVLDLIILIYIAKSLVIEHNNVFELLVGFGLCTFIGYVFSGNLEGLIKELRK